MSSADLLSLFPNASAIKLRLSFKFSSPYTNFINSFTFSTISFEKSFSSVIGIIPNSSGKNLLSISCLISPSVPLTINLFSDNSNTSSLFAIISPDLFIEYLPIIQPTA